MNAGLQSDLIAAVATAPGQGGIGVVRLSGPGAHAVAQRICNRSLKPRFATYCDFRDGEEIIDQGLALLFAEGASFTGEEIVELQGHGGPVVLQRLLDVVCAHGARLARPGEFSERAFLNGKIDLAQAEAIADLIASTSVNAARAALRSLQGAFSTRVHALEEDLGGLRVLIEACIDFPEEDVDFLQEAQVHERVAVLIDALEGLKRECAQGQLLNEGASVALIGAPNAGKSSLLNVLAGEEAAIVTDIPGTTRDLLKVDLVLDGLPLRLVDTAGLRDSADAVERLGVARAREQAQQADILLVMVDVSALPASADSPHTVSALHHAVADLLSDLAFDGKVIVVANKVDLLGSSVQMPATPLPYPTYWVSAKTGAGLEALRSGIAEALGFAHTETGFTARARHVEALDSAETALRTGLAMLQAGDGTEMVAEELRAAHLALGEIVGTVTPDELLGRIFSEFCIGK
jgi:tRNA modification GTPase